MLLGIDIGTTAVKALAVDEQARVQGEAGVEYGIRAPRPGWSEQDAEDWWTCAVQATRRALAGMDDRAVRAVGISTQGDTMVPVDAAGRPLAPARTWMDTRTAELIPALEADPGPDDWARIAGSAPGPYAAALTVLWLRERVPHVYRAAARFALVADFIIQRMTGAPALDEPNASRTLLFDIRSRAWSPSLMERVGATPDRLSPTMPSGTVAGTLTPQAAEALGLPPGIAVATGGHDQTCAAVGAGVVRPGTMLLSCGTAWVQLVAADRPLVEPRMAAVQTYCHAAPGRWALLSAHAGGNVLSWLRDTFCAGRDISYDDLSAAAEEADASGKPAVILLPHFYGSRRPAYMRNARGVLLGLSLSADLGDLALAAFRGVALEASRNFDFFRDLGAAPAEARMIGGGARSAFWAQMVADAGGVTVFRPEVREAAAYGAAILAGVAVGTFSSVEDVVDALPMRDALPPDPSRRDLYEGLRARFDEAREALGPVWERVG